MQKSFFFICFIGLCCLIGCTSHETNLKSLPVPSADTATDIPKIRFSALEQTAMSLGAQTALAWVSKGINASLTRDERNLNTIFNFNPLLLNNNVLPPVLSEGQDSVAQDDATALRLADKIYKIESPPRFVTAAPTWRSYLWMRYKTPERPNNTLLPRNSTEIKTWNQAYDKGWQEGVLQANLIFSENMGRLKRDYNGMLLYRKLLNENIVTAPFVAKSELGVTGDSNQIRINDQVLRITATSRLVTDPQEWKPVVVPGTPSAIRKQGTAGTDTLE